MSDKWVKVTGTWKKPSGFLTVCKSYKILDDTNDSSDRVAKIVGDTGKVHYVLTTYGAKCPHGYTYEVLDYTPKDIQEHTQHYQSGDIECVDYLYDNMPFEAFVGGLEWNIKKYLHRWRYKEAPVKDLRKARDYLSVLIEVMEGNKPEFKEWNSQKENTLK